MARKKGGGFNRVLEFIGLVDDGAPRDAYEEEYAADDYGRPPVYNPPRNTPRESNRGRGSQPTVRRPNSDYQPTRAPRMNRGGASSARFDDTRAASRRSADYSARSASSARANRYDYSPRPASRFDETSRFEETPEASVPQRAASRSRTIMFSLHALEDCCDVIDNLVLGNTVVITMSDLDSALVRRAVDTLSGAVFALHATIRKASDLTYLIAPMSVEVNADEEFDAGYRRSER